MKSKILIVAALFSIIFGSCKNETETKKTEATGTEEVKANFIAEFDLTSDKDNVIALYYTEDGSIAFNADKVFWSDIKAGPDFQKYIITAPDGKLPTSIRVDFGTKPGADKATITLKTLKITCYNKTIEIKGDNFLQYFVKNENVETAVDAAAGTITFKADPKNKADHFYYPQQLLLDELKKIEN
jgi:hypothetical protein